jgi:hypothetical protein
MRRWAGTDRSISWPVQTPTAHLSRLSTGTTTIPTSVSRGGGRYGASFGSACQARPGPPADQPGVGSAQWDLQLRPDDSTTGGGRPAPEGHDRELYPHSGAWPFGLWIVIVPLDAPGLVGRRDDPRPGIGQLGAGVSEGARHRVECPLQRPDLTHPDSGTRTGRSPPASGSAMVSYGVPRCDAIVFATNAGDTHRRIK